MTKRVLAYALLVAVIFGAFLGFFALEQHSKDQQMQACVAAGKDWIRDMGNYYECKE